MTNKFECIVSADLMRRALLGVSTEETRYYLNGVHISPSPEGGAVLTATDGHMLISLHDPDGIVSGEGIVCLSKPMKLALKSSGVLVDKRLLLMRATNGTGRAFVADISTRGPGEDYSPYIESQTLFEEPDRRVLSAQFGPVMIDGNFPDWRRVVPTKLRADAPLPVVEQKLLARIAEALCSNDKRRVLCLTATGDDPAAEPILATAANSPGAPSAFAVVMPIRTERQTATVPTWAAKQPAPMAAE